MKKVVVGIIKKHVGAETEYLLMSSKTDFGKFTGYFYPPGGHVEEDESPVETLKREFQEEFRVKVEPLKQIAETPGDVKDQITYWWECDLKEGEFNLQVDEVAEVGWFTKKQISEMEKVWPATKKFFSEFIDAG